MKSLPLLLMLAVMVFALGMAPSGVQALDTNTGQTFQTDPTLAVPTLPIDIGPTSAPDDPGAGGNTLLLVGVVILGLILLVLLIWAISRSSHTHE